MQNLKKALSVFLTVVMMFTTLCFFPVSIAVTKAEAAVVNTGNETVFHVPETIYLYPDVTSWTASVKTPFQYYVNNTVNTADIYAAPVVEANLDSEGKLYAAAKEGMSDVRLNVKFVNLDGSYMNEADYGTVNYEIEEKDGYWYIKVTDGISPELAASVFGCYIEWGLTYKNAIGEVKALFNYTYIYKPYVVPYGAATRVYNEKGDINVYGQHITWVTGVHSINTTAAQTNTLYPYYRTVASESATQFAFSPFLSKDNKAFVGGVQVSGAAPVQNGAYNAVFSGTDTSNAYFHAGQTGAALDSSEKVRAWFYTANSSNTYPAAFDYINPSTVSAQYALSQVTPTRTGSITVDISRYNNLNEIPNLGVGMMIADVDYRDALTTSTVCPTAQWYVGDATGLTHAATGAYDTSAALTGANEAVNVKFASAKNLTTPLTKGIIYAGPWNSAIDDEKGTKTYTVKGYYESIDRELDRQAASAAINLSVTKVDKTALREAINRAVSYMSTLGVKENWNSYYYDISYIDPDRNISAWERFRTAYIYACGVLGNVNDTIFNPDEYAAELNASLDALLSGKGLRVYFDVNHDDIGVNLWIPVTAGESASGLSYTWNAADETVIINGTDANSGTRFGATVFTPTGTFPYTTSVEKLSGTFSGSGCTVIETNDASGNYLFANTDGTTTRYNFDNFTGDSAKKTFTYSENHFGSIEKMSFRTWYDTANTVNSADKFTARIKIEQGNSKTEYSPAGKIVTGTVYGSLPAPTREGYTFEGWYTDESLTSRVTADSAVSARILYAKWIPNAYSVSYDNMFNMNEWATVGTAIGAGGEIYNGKADYNAENSSITITSDAVKGESYTTWNISSYGVEIKPNTTYRFSYTVSGHNGIGQHQAFMFSYADGDTADFANGVSWSSVNKYTAGDGDYYIDFTTGEKADTFRIRLGTNNADSAESVVVTFSNLKLTEKTDYNLGLNISHTEKTAIFDSESYGELATATRDGYVFDGWYTADGEKITADTPVKSENIHVYSSWVPNQYSVAFDGNTGLGGLGMTNAVYDIPFVLPANYFIKTGYTFVGWSLTPGGEAVYADEEEVKNLTAEVNGSVTLYAVWQANTFNVSFDKNGGEGTMADVAVIYDSEVTLPGCAFTRTGYTFTGWSLTPDGATLLTDVEYDNLRTEDGEEVTLYAIWSENSYTLSFDMNGGTGTKIEPTVYGYEAVVTLPKNVFTKTGYILSGWSLERNGEQVYSNGETVTHINPDKNGSVTLYALWTPVKYTIQFNANSGTGTMDSIQMTYDTEAVLTANTFTKTGYHFLGWATSPTGAVVHTDKKTVKNLTASDAAVITLYAVWEINTYKVTFNYYNSQGVWKSTTVNVTHGSAATVPSDFTRTPMMNDESHYVFTGWSADISNITGDLSVNAKYPSSSIEAHNMSEYVKDSTCAQVGYTRYFCTACSYEYSVEIPLKSHQWNDGSVDKEPGCTTNGTMVYSCANCTNTKAEAISPLGHTFVNYPAKAATCSEEGNIAHKHCERCAQCFSSDAANNAPDSEALTDSQVKIAKLPHTKGAEATCTTAQICTVCKEVLVAALGHTEKTEYITTDATCIKEGTVTVKVTCTVCSAIVSETTEKRTVPHTYSETVTAPTCTEAGFTTFTCSVCGDTYKGNTVPAKGHTEGEWRETEAPDCNSEGVETNYCSVCGTGFKTRVVPAQGHDSGEWKITTPAKCEEWGEESLCCTKCGAVITVRGIQPKGHGTVRDEITVQAGCETAGRLSKICNDCNEELSFTVIPETGHTPKSAASCETDSVCASCGTLLEERFGHDWDNGVVTKEPTDVEEGVLTYTCKNDPSHKKTAVIPVRDIINLPIIPEDGTVDFDAPESGFIGNIHNMIEVEEGLGYVVTIEDTSVIYMDSLGNMTALKDGETEITITTSDGYSKSFKAAVRTLKTVTFDIRGEKTTVRAYVGNKVTAPEVDSYVADGFTFRFKAWAVNGNEVKELIVTGDMTFVAVYTSSCDYSEIDRLEGILNDLISGDYDNELLINSNKAQINAAQEMIAEFKAQRDIRDSSEQPLVDAAADYVSDTIVSIYPKTDAYLEIRGEEEAYAGTFIDVTAYIMPINVKVSDGVWSSSDTATGFFTNGKFFAVKTGSVTLTVNKDNLSADFTVSIIGGIGARVIMFDTMLSNVNYIVENTYIIKTTTNIFWAPDAPISFRLIDDGTFETYQVYFNDEIAIPDQDGIYTIPANVGDVHVKANGLMNNPDDDNGGKISFWEMIMNFFRRIGDFFRNLFNFG